MARLDVSQVSRHRVVKGDKLTVILVFSSTVSSNLAKRACSLDTVASREGGVRVSDERGGQSTRRGTADHET